MFVITMHASTLPYWVVSTSIAVRDACPVPFIIRYHKHVRQNAKKFLSNFVFVLSSLRFRLSHRLSANVSNCIHTAHTSQFAGSKVGCRTDTENCFKHTYVITVHMYDKLTLTHAHKFRLLKWKVRNSITLGKFKKIRFPHIQRKHAYEDGREEIPTRKRPTTYSSHMEPE